MTNDSLHPYPVVMLECMMLIRSYEERLIALQASGGAAGTCTSVGQEASSVGVIHALTSDDQILTNHRSAGHLIARGADLGRLFAEVMGRSDGYCKGKSGSLHISVAELGVVLTSTIVGAELSLATGVALSKSILRSPGIVTCLFGDGAACQGSFHESLNLAAVWNLPILYVCENNQWQAFVHRKETMLTEHISVRGSGYGVKSRTVDGNNVEEVYAAAREARQYILDTGKPFLLETLTYRQRGHFEPDDQAYVDQAELTRWLENDPIHKLQQQLINAGTLAKADVARIQENINVFLEDAVEFSQKSPFPEHSELTKDVYA